MKQFPMPGRGFLEEIVFGGESERVKRDRLKVAYRQSGGCRHRHCLARARVRNG